MLGDLTWATRYEIDKAREIIYGLVGEKRLLYNRLKIERAATL